jgi:hypothetical protein
MSWKDKFLKPKVGDKIRFRKWKTSCPGGNYENINTETIYTIRNIDRDRDWYFIDVDRDLFLYREEFVLVK